MPFLLSLERRDASWGTRKLTAMDLIRLVCLEFLGLDFPLSLLFLFYLWLLLGLLRLLVFLRFGRRSVFVD
jgi:hypothetical protein